LLAELQKNIQALLTGQFAIIFAVRLFGFGEIAKFGDRSLDATSYHFQPSFRMKSDADVKILLLFPLTV